MAALVKVDAADREFFATVAQTAFCNPFSEQRAELDERIDARVRQMLAAGLVDEVRRLVAAGLKANSSAARAIGYRETIDCLEGRMREDELSSAIGKNTRALVRKQLTWFRTQLPPHGLRSAGETDGRPLF